MSQILIQKLGALLHISPLLRSPNHNLQKTALSLLGNVSRAGSVQSTMGKEKHLFCRQQCRASPHKTDALHVSHVSSIAKEMLPELAGLLCSGPREMGNSDETIATTCNTVRTLMLSNSEASKKFLNNEIVTSLADLSENG